MMRFEPRLRVDAETAGQIEMETIPSLESCTTIATEA